MGLFSFLKKLFTGGSKDNNLKYLYYQCHRCKKGFKLLLRKSYDIQTLYDDHPEYAYLYQKELRDPECFNDIKFKVYFDSGYNIAEAEVKGGKLISREKYLELTSTNKEEEEK